jgi:hypothetical protein
MNLMGHIRRSRSLPRMFLAMVALIVAQTALVPCVMAYPASAGEMGEHCTHCPPDSAMSADASDCSLPEAVKTNLIAVTAHHASLLDLSPLLQTAPFDLGNLRQVQTRLLPTIDHFHPPTRRLYLTHCVQLK